MTQPPSSNDPGYMNEAFENAKIRLSKTVTGFDANNPSFFNETDRHKEENSSSDQAYLEQMVEKNMHRFRH